MKHLFVTGFLLLYLAGSNLFAQNIKLYAEAVKHFKLNEKTIAKDLMLEKVLPYDKSKTLLLIPNISNTDEEATFFVYDCYLILMESKTGKILNSYVEKNAWESDAIHLTHFEFDFAPYKLDKTTRAFGVRVTYSNTSKPNPYSETTLSLFICSENKIKPMLQNYTVYRYSGEWDIKCNGKFTTEEKIILLAETSSMGYKDLIIKNTVTTTTNKFIKEGDCREENSSIKKSETLKFSGTRYQK